MAGATTATASSGGGSSRACKGICQVLSGVTTTTVMGVLTLEQPNVHQPVHITGKLTGLTPGKHGVSVCVAGDLSQGPSSCGPIFNPFGM
jgi:superoxide dismutase, Cu-Zn family